uniref:alpha-1,2-Mannosidase n=1 Tax=Lepeophtheirus salmonis TaxID=72036 RepID=A0A0K2UH06_LEPSM
MSLKRPKNGLIPTWDTHLDFNISKDVNLFETTIRLLGGLLSAFHLTHKKHDVLLEKATDLGNRLLGGFKTPSGIPYSDINLKTAKGHVPRWSPDSSTSEVTTLQLEFRDLSRCTSNPEYEDMAFQVSKKVHESTKWHGLVPIFINVETGDFQKSSTITLGARGDSYYEYLLKQWVQTGKTHEFLKEDYIEAIEGIKNWLTKRTAINNYLFVGEVQWGGHNFKPKMDELVCFLPGTLALGVHHGMPESHMEMAKELIETCYQTFATNPTHLAPEITYFNFKSGSKKDFYIKSNDAHYLLRPETVESLWYMFYMTKDPIYQDWGWNIFQGIEKYTKYANGYSNIGNVRSALDTKPRDLMETYFLAETLKYFYLLFSDKNEIDLQKWVFNTEGHPLPVYES